MMMTVCIVCRRLQRRETLHTFTFLLISHINSLHHKKSSALYLFELQTLLLLVKFISHPTLPIPFPLLQNSTPPFTYLLYGGLLDLLLSLPL